MNEPLPTLKQLRHFAALAEHKHFGKAAAACFVTQSTLSASLKELEEILQAPLVDRTKRQVVLTPLGEETVARARKLLEDARDLTLAAQAAREPLSGTVRLGVIPTIAPFLLPRILPGLRTAYPKLKLYLREEQTAPLVAQLHDGQLDVLLMALPYDCGNVETAELFNDRFSLALPKDHPLASSARSRPRRRGARRCCCWRTATACATTRCRPAASAPRATPRPSRPPACKPWCRWRPTAWASPCCRNSPSMAAFSPAATW